jgi:hypothetical protein
VSLAARARAASTERRAVFAVIGAVVLWSASSLFVRAGESDALVFTTYRLWFALPPLAVGAYLRARHHPERRLVPPGVERGHWLLVMLGAGAFFVGGASTAFAALGMTRLLDVTLIGALSPIIVIAFAVAFLGEHVHRGEPARSQLLQVSQALDIPLRHFSVVRYSGDFYGQTATGLSYPEGLNAERLMQTLAALPTGITELGCHPGLGDDVDSIYRTERTEELNRRTIDVLAGVSGRDPTPDPKNWWQWWSDFTDTAPF